MKPSIHAGRVAFTIFALGLATYGDSRGQSLKSTGVMREQRAAHTATLLADGRILIAGGFKKGPDGVSQVYFSSAELYDPAKHTFTSTGSMEHRRCGHTATLLRNGLVLIAGGAGDMGLLSSAELYNPATESFVSIAPMHIRRADFTATLLSDGRVLLCGGGNRDAQATAEIFDPATKEFTMTGQMTAPRLAHTATLLPDGQVLITGGSSKRYVVLASAELYNPVTGEFTRVGDMTQPRYKHAAAGGPEGTVLVLGGSTKDDWRGTLSIVERYDPLKRSFTQVPDLQRPRFKMPQAVVTLSNGSILLAGGDAAVELLNPATGESRVVGSLGNPRYYGTATLLKNGDVLIAGGYDERLRSTNKAWIFTE
jgi:WD40 repeat protein